MKTRSLKYLLIAPTAATLFACEWASASPKEQADPPPAPFPLMAAPAVREAGVGSVWGHTTNTQSVYNVAVTSMVSDQVAHGLGDLVTVVVDLQNTINKNQNTTTAKTTSASSVLTSLVYPNPNNQSNGWNFLNNQGQPPTTAWNSSLAFNGGGTLANQETASTTIEAQIIEVEPNGVFRIQAYRHSKAGGEDTSMVLTGLLRREDLSSTNTVSSSRLINLQIIQKGKGAISEDQKKGWLTKIYEFITPF